MERRRGARSSPLDYRTARGRSGESLGCAAVIENVVLIDEEDAALGEGEKLDVHRSGVLHRAFSVFAFNAAGELLLQRRALTKYHSGGLWTNTLLRAPAARRGDRRRGPPPARRGARDRLRRAAPRGRAALPRRDRRPRRERARPPARDRGLRDAACPTRTRSSSGASSRPTSWTPGSKRAPRTSPPGSPPRWRIVRG